MEIVITWYNESMRDQVISMFEKEYNLERQHFTTLFENFYFHTFQKNKCILIVALDGEKVAGFQSFFYWPYTFAGKTLNTFQSGNSLVHPYYRGKGIFQKMLAFIDKENKTIGIDHLMGFPVEVSLKNFIKDKWENIFNLKWHVKTGNPFAFFSPKLDYCEKGLAYLDNLEENKLRLSSENEFITWRNHYLDKNIYFSFIFKKENETIVFHLKKNKRKKVINEVIIGNVLFSGEKAKTILKDALKALISKAKTSFHFISIAINEEGDKELKKTLRELNFKQTDKSIYFITKPFNNREIVLNPSSWIAYRSDIDTW